MHLRFIEQTACAMGFTKHAEIVMRELGITYTSARCVPLADQWWFLNCGNVPSTLPTFLVPLNQFYVVDCVVEEVVTASGLLYDQAALDAAVAAERERCAIVCENLRIINRDVDKFDCANAIRFDA
jgi:hypothetical protein